MINGFCCDGSWEFLGNLGTGGWIGLILIFLFWVGMLAVLTLLVIWVIRLSRTAGLISQSSGQPTAREILQARYARGEITREQYELVKQELV